MTVTPSPQSVVTVEVSGLTGSGKSAVMGEIEIALKALGLTVEHDAAFQAEKNGTHADWQEALDLYRPTVVLTERNVSRAPAPSSLAGGAFDHIHRLAVEFNPAMHDIDQVLSEINQIALAALSPEAPATGFMATLTDEQRAEALAYTGPDSHPEAPAREVEAYDKFKAPVGSTVWIRATVTDNCTSCCCVVIDAIHGKMHLTVVPRDVALTPRHEAQASPTERELDLLDAVMRAGGIVKTAAALPDKAAHLSLLTDALNRADAILTDGLNGAPVSHEAPAEGAGEDFYAVGEFIGRQPVLCVHGSTDPNNLCPYCEGEKIWGGRNYRARSSAPEAREGEAVAWDHAVRYLDNPWKLASDFPPDFFEEIQSDPKWKVQPLYTHPAAPSADKLREDFEGLMDSVNVAIKQADWMNNFSGTDEMEKEAVRLVLAPIRQALATLKGGA